VAGRHRGLQGVELLDKVVDIDQKPIGRTPRSNPATYTKVFDAIRSVFALTQEARTYGYGPGRFSFNMKGGRCEACEGDGVKLVEMHFLADVYVPCEVCAGKRFNEATLRVRFKGKNIAEVLEMSVREAREHFSAHRDIERILGTLEDVGLGYVRLGQSSPTLSGGEAQRIKLSRELARVATGRTLYILDEPTTGLHFEDIRKLLRVLDRLVEAGNTVVVIEHNLDVIKSADWLIDLGPEGGAGGGRVLATGTPEQLAHVEESFTGQYLSRVLKTPGPKRSRASALASA
jgi:excinuclease ABC subunit A